MAMTHEQVLHHKVGELRTRIRLLVAQQWVCVGLTGAALASLLLVAATKLQWWTDAVDYIWAMFLLGAVLGAVYGWTRRITPLVAAQIADDRGGLKERLSTAVEISAKTDRGEIAQAQLADAAEHASSLRPAEVLPWRIPAQWRYAAAAVVVLLAAIYVPQLPIFHSTQERLDNEALRLQGEKLQHVAKELEKTAKEKKDDKNAEILRQISQNMKQLGKDAAKNRISKKQAMLKLGELQKQMKEAQEKATGGGKAEKPMSQVAEDMQKKSDQESLHGNGEAARQLKQMADNMSHNDMEGAKRQLEELARRMQSGEMTPEDAGKMADMLQQMAQAMDKSSLDKAGQQMKDAANQLRQAADAARQLQQKLASAKSDSERKQIQQQMRQAMQQAQQMAANQTHQAGGTCNSSGKNQQSAGNLQQMAQSLQSAQQSLQQAGQQQAQGSQGASESEMGQEFGQSQQGQGGQQGKSGQQGQGGQQGRGKSGQGQSGQSTSSSGQRGRGRGPGMGGPGIGAGGSAGPQQPLPGPKRDKLVSGIVNEKGQKLTRTYMGTPDPTQDRAAYFSVVPDRARAAEASLNREDIPISEKKAVKSYFDSIQPH